LGRSWKAGLALLAPLAAGAVLAGCGGGGGKSGPDLKTLLAEQVQPPTHAEIGPGVDPDDTAASSPQFSSTILSLGGDRYQLTVTNGSDLGFLNSFTWVHPPQLRITAVTKSSAGTCRLVDGNVACTGLAIKPPKCTCEAGGSAWVRFAARQTQAAAKGQQYGLRDGWLRIGGLTPVPYTIPSYRGKPPVDLPICAKGERSTDAKPCVHSGR
jgi:hypothetical protein